MSNAPEMVITNQKRISEYTCGFSFVNMSNGFGY